MSETEVGEYPLSPEAKDFIESAAILAEPYEERIAALEARIEELAAERDRAREECGHAKAMRASISDELTRFVRLKMDACAELTATEGDLAVAIREAGRCREALRQAHAMILLDTLEALRIIEAALDKRLATQ